MRLSLYLLTLTLPPLLLCGTRYGVVATDDETTTNIQTKRTITKTLQQRDCHTHLQYTNEQVAEMRDHLIAYRQKRDLMTKVDLVGFSSVQWLTISFVKFVTSNGTYDVPSIVLIQAIDLLNRAFSGKDNDNRYYRLPPPKYSETNIRFQLGGITTYVDDGNATGGCFNYTKDFTTLFSQTSQGSKHITVFICKSSHQHHGGGASTMPCLSTQTFMAVGHDTFKPHPLAPEYVPAPGMLGDTMTHHMGHVCGLLHTFSADGSCDFCFEYEGHTSPPTCFADLVQDTPSQSDPIYGDCPPRLEYENPVDSCPFSPGFDDVGNFMDLSSDLCSDHFTNGQAGLMKSQIDKCFPTLVNVFVKPYVNMTSPGNALPYSMCKSPCSTAVMPNGNPSPPLGWCYAYGALVQGGDGGWGTCRTSGNTRAPTVKPTGLPTTKFPTLHPTTPKPTQCTCRPTMKPTQLPKFLTVHPTIKPSMYPTTTKAPTNFPSTRMPTTRSPTAMPTTKPTKFPTNHPITKSPTSRPSKRPTMNPTIKTPTTRSPYKYPTSKPVPWTCHCEQCEASSVMAGGNASYIFFTDGSAKMMGEGVGSQNTFQGNQANEVGMREARVNTTQPIVKFWAGVGNVFVQSRRDVPSGIVRGMGLNQFGCLGLGHVQPVAGVDDASSILDLAGAPVIMLDANSRQGHVLAVLMDPKSLIPYVTGWGNNANGALGMGNTVNYGSFPGSMGTHLPRTSLGSDFGPAAAGVSAGVDFQCAWDAYGNVKCWGRPAYFFPGITNTSLIWGNTPETMGDALPRLNFNSRVKKVDGNERVKCALFETGQVQCFGVNELVNGSTFGQGVVTGAIVPFQSNVANNHVDLGLHVLAIDVIVRGNVVVAITTTGSIMLWGDASLGVLGFFPPHGETEWGYGATHMGSYLPTLAFSNKPGTLNSIQSFALAATFACVVRSTGVTELVCWGATRNMGLGSNPFNISLPNGYFPSQPQDQILNLQPIDASCFTYSPSATPSMAPSKSPTRFPTKRPTEPTKSPSKSPTNPTRSPSRTPTRPSRSPSRTPTRPTWFTWSPTSLWPTKSPVHHPSRSPSKSKAPSKAPRTPSKSPTHQTLKPSRAPVGPTSSPRVPSSGNVTQG